MKKVIKHMKIVLVKEVQNLGQVGDIKDVKPGFARNFLLKQNLALRVDDPKAQAIISEKRQRQEKISQEKVKAVKNFQKIAEKELVFRVKANKSGKLYKTVKPKDIADKLGISTKMVSTKPIEKIGNYQVKIKEGDLEREVSVVVTPQT